MSNDDRSRNERPCDGITLKPPCRRSLLRSGPPAPKELLPQVRIVTDPSKLALLKAEAARRRQIAGPNCKVTGRRPTP
jgi:hypothetical protein